LGNVLDAAERALQVHGCAALTLETVAKDANCTKGLVHYHFGTRTKLLIAASDRLWEKRENNWTAALRGGAPEECIRETWSLLQRETASGVTRAWLSLLVDADRVLGQAVRRRMDRFDTALRIAAGALLDRLGQTPTIPRDEWSRLLTAGIDGVSLQMVARGQNPSLEADYSAVWLGALNLTTPTGS
jgi:AcrR family transcriptional regulator